MSLMSFPLKIMFFVGFPGLSLMLLILWHGAIIQEVSKLCISASYFPRQCQVGHESPHYHHCHHCQHLSHQDEVYFIIDSSKSHHKKSSAFSLAARKYFLRGHILSDDQLSRTYCCFSQNPKQIEGFNLGMYHSPSFMTYCCFVSKNLPAS